MSVNFVLRLGKSIFSLEFFQCNNGKHISIWNVCDFKDDCGYKIDESGSYGALCDMLNYVFCNNDIYSPEQSHEVDLGFQILPSMKNWHPLNLLISKYCCLNTVVKTSSQFNCSTSLLKLS